MPDWRSEGIGRYMRGRKEIKQKVVVTVMVDTSGSVSKKMYTLFMNEIISIMGQIKGDSELNLILWHSNVYSTSDEFHIDPSDVNKIKSAPFQNGGTMFYSAVDFYDQNKADLDETNILIVFTDGQFFVPRDMDPNLLSVIPDNVKIVFALFQPSMREYIDKYKHPNISVIETNIHG
jgi:predicted metal-dependent peptidase